MRGVLKLLSVLAVLCAALVGAAAPAVLEDMAGEVIKDVGLVLSIIEGQPDQVVFVFEENHVSILQQVEIAIMLNRLYADFGLRHIGLEGLMAPKVLDCSWAHRGEPYRPNQPITGREDVIATTLEQGEIGSAEFMSLIYVDVVVHGVDDAVLYAQGVAEDAWQAPYDYLYAIALAGMTRAQRATWETLYKQKLYDDAFRYAVSTQPFCAARLALLEDRVDMISAEDMIQILDELKAQAAKVKAQLEVFPKAAENLPLLREYLEVVSRRSDAMAAQMAALAQAHPGAPLAMTIGAMHTDRVVEKLKAAGITVIVVRTHAQAEGITAGTLSADGYRRKEEGRSVAPDGWLASFLDGRKKPEPTAERRWYKEEQLFRELAQYLADWASFHHSNDASVRWIEENLRYEMRVQPHPALVDLRRLGWDLATLTVEFRSAPGGPEPPAVVLEFRRSNPTGTTSSLHFVAVPKQAGGRWVKRVNLLGDVLLGMRSNLLLQEPPATGPVPQEKVERGCSTTEIHSVRTSG